MTDSWTTLNLGSGGDNMDEEAVSYTTEPTTRKRARIVIAGSTAFEIARITNNDPNENEFALVTRNIPSGIQSTQTPGTYVCEFGEISSVSSNQLSTVTSYNVPSGSTFYFTGASGSGDVDAKYEIRIDGQVKLKLRTVLTNPNLNFETKTPIKVNNSIQVDVIHNESGVDGNFNATILGYVI